MNRYAPAQPGRRAQRLPRATHTLALTACAALVGWFAVVPAAERADATLGLTFQPREIATNFGVGYAVTTADVNGDGRVDVLAISGTELAWFENPSWQKHTVLGPGATVADNVALAPHDIDGDGRLDVVLAAGWTGKNIGTLQWVRQGRPGEPWQVFQIDAEPTMHRIGWADVNGDGRKELIAAPLHGRDGKGARLLVYTVPATPQTDRWPMEVADDQNNIMHNFTVLKLPAHDTKDTIVTASREGLFAIQREASGAWSRTQIGEGAPGEVKLGVVDGRRMLATVDPWHGASLVVYGEEPRGLWTKTVIESEMTEGHALGWGDLTGDGRDELVAGWRSGPGAGLAVYAVDRDGRLRARQAVETGITGLPAPGQGRRGGGRGTVEPPQGMDTEDLTIADLDANGRPDIVAAGRATRNVKIYWNQPK